MAPDLHASERRGHNLDAQKYKAQAALDLTTPAETKINNLSCTYLWVSHVTVDEFHLLLLQQVQHALHRRTAAELEVGEPARLHVHTCTTGPDKFVKKSC